MAKSRRMIQVLECVDENILELYTLDGILIVSMDLKPAEPEAKPVEKKETIVKRAQ